MTNTQTRISALVAGPDCSDYWRAAFVSRAREFTTLRRAVRNGMKGGLAGLVMAVAICVSLPARAMPFTQTLDFVTASDQSLWGTGGVSGGFSYSGNTSFTVLGFDVGLGYRLGASSGTALTKFKGDMRVDYIPSLSLPGITALDLRFQGDGDGGKLKTDLGARAQMWAGPITVGPDVLLGIDKGYTPQLDQPVSGNDSTKAATIELVNLLAAKAGVDMNVAQTDHFMATAIDGFLNYSLRGSPAITSIPFSLATDAGLSLDVALGGVGTWDFWFVDQTLENEFSTSLDLALVLFEEHYSPHGCCIFGVCTCNFYWDRNDTTVASINVYDGAAFPLAFNRISNLDGFSIQVGTTQVPEPTSLALVGIGLASLAGLRRKNLPS